MQAEAFAYAQCTRFAAAARRHGNGEIANLFSSTADVDRCSHFAEEFAFCCPAGSEAENLKAACEFKTAQIERYHQFVREALQDEDTKSAALFNKICQQEVRELENLKTAMHQASETVGELVTA